MRPFMLSMVTCVAVFCCAAEVLDDTAFIQSLLDRGGEVRLPAREYRISRMLQLGSDTHLRFDEGASIRLLPGSDCPLAGNRDIASGSRNISIEGGVWDMDNLRQSPNPYWRQLCKPPLPKTVFPPKFDPAFYRGNAFYFENVAGFSVKGITIRNPVTYGFQMCRVSDFTVSDITFDYTACNPIKGNMDGIHLDGGCHHGRILNLRGNCWDDSVALNANDGRCAAYQGPITDILVDGVHAECGHSAVRMLSTGAPVERITIRNVSGRFYAYAIGFTHFFGDRPQQGVFSDVTIEHVKVGKGKVPGDFPWPDALKAFPVLFYDANIRVDGLKLDDVELWPVGR